MTAVQRLLLLVGIGVAVSGFLLRHKIQTVEGQIVVTAKKIWDAIPATAQPYIALLHSAEANFGLPPTLLTRMAWIESRFNPRAQSPAGAQGIMQIVPSAHPGVDPYNPQVAIPYAGQFLAALHRQFGSWDKAIAAYNWGPGNLAKAIAANGANWRLHLPAETLSYLAQVESVIDLA